jgi:hypothetical protein
MNFNETLRTTAAIISIVNFAWGILSMFDAFPSSHEFQQLLNSFTPVARLLIYLFFETALCLYLSVLIVKYIDIAHFRGLVVPILAVSAATTIFNVEYFLISTKASGLSFYAAYATSIAISAILVFISAFNSDRYERVTTGLGYLKVGAPKDYKLIDSVYSSRDDRAIEVTGFHLLAILLFLFLREII